MICDIYHINNSIDSSAMPFPQALKSGLSSYVQIFTVTLPLVTLLMLNTTVGISSLNRPNRLTGTKVVLPECCSLTSISAISPSKRVSGTSPAGRTWALACWQLGGRAAMIQQWPLHQSSSGPWCDTDGIQVGRYRWAAMARARKLNRSYQNYFCHF